MANFRRPRTNFQIRTPQVLVIDETGKKLGVLNTREAIGMAQDKGLDLVEIVPQQTPPITRIMDFGKWIYEKQKAARKTAKEARGQEFKTVRLGLTTEKHDMEFKAKKADEFLKKGAKVQIEMRLKGRQVILKNAAKEKMKKFLEYLKEPHKTEGAIKEQGRRLTLIVIKEK